MPEYRFQVSLRRFHRIIAFKAIVRCQLENLIPSIADYLRHYFPEHDVMALECEMLPGQESVG